MGEKKFARDWSKTSEKIANGEKKDYTDKRLFVPTFKDGVSETIIRFLPPKENDVDVPYVSKYHHYFANGTRKFFNDCPTSIKGKCPVCEFNGDHWDSYSKEEQNRKRRLKYFTNILVVNDPEHPENNGKVFLFAYGLKIHEKIMKKTSKDPKGIRKPVMIWDYYDGCNFILSIKETKDGNNYDASEFESVSAVGTDAEIEKVDNQLMSLKEFVDPARFKSYEELQKRFFEVIGQKTEAAPEKTKQSSKPAVEETEDEDDTLGDIEVDGQSIDDLLTQGND